MQKKNQIRSGNSWKWCQRLCVALFVFSVLIWVEVYSLIPGSLTVARDQENKKLFQGQIPGWVEESVEESVAAEAKPSSDIPSDNLKKTMENAGDGRGDSYVVQCSAFGVIPIKQVHVDIVERQKVIPCGSAVGIYMKTQGVLIVGTGEVGDIHGEMQEPTGDIVHSGDYILAVNDVPVTEKEEVVRQMNQAVNGSVTLSVLRNEEILKLKVPVVQTGQGEYRAGIWIRDDTQGIGTLTYTTKLGAFGALGHGISDIDTSTLLTLEGGNLYKTQIQSIIKGVHGMPGEVSGEIHYDEKNILGDITDNTEIGIFGTLSGEGQKLREGQEMEVAYKQEVSCGNAKLLSEVSGELKTYDIEIERVDLNSSDANKSMVIRITDPELLELTGGIIQGMSGSPILKDGKVVGAVTHVFVNDPAKGYGIFIEDMMEH